MELSLSGNSLKTLHRCVTCLARIGSELVLHGSPSQLAFHTLNSSRSAYQSITFKIDFFDSYTLLSSLSPEIRCSVLLKSVCSIFRTPVSSLSLLYIRLPSPDASKLQWTLHCQNGARKTYCISCNVEPEIQQLSLDRRRLPTSFVARPRDLTRLLSNFQSSLQEITIIATDPSTVPSNAEEEIGGKAVELRSYIDPAKDNSDATLHTQLWIDPVEEFLQYRHIGDPADITFSLKELKAFLSFCEGCEVDIHLFFEKAGEPILMAPRFGFDDGTNSDFDATLVLATILISQLNETNASVHSHAVPLPQGSDVRRNRSQWHARAAGSSPTSEHPSDHTKIWSDLSGPVARSPEYCRIRQAPVEENPNLQAFDFVQRPEMVNVSGIPPAREIEINIEEPPPLESSNQKTSSLPFTTSEHSGEELIFNYISDPFGFTVRWRSNGESLFNSSAEAEDPYASIVFKDQYLEVSTRLPMSSSLYGLGENTQPGGIRLQLNDPYTLYTTDISAINLNTDLYGSHPVYMGLRNGNIEIAAHVILLLNSNGMDAFYRGSSLTYKIIGGVFDFYLLSGPTPLDVINQYIFNWQASPHALLGSSKLGSVRKTSLLQYVV